MIELRNVTFQYDNAEDETLKHINLTVHRGECVLLVGESGSGKTALGRLVNGLIPHFYEGKLSGSVTVAGLAVSTAELYETARKVGSVFQNPRSQFFCVDTTSEIAFGCENLGMPEEHIRKRVQAVSEELEITGLLDRDIFSLSGGEKQKIACASVSAVEPEVVVMDEPTSNLDMESIVKLKQVISLWKRQGKTVLIAEHRLYWLTELCDRVLYLKNGCIEQDISMRMFLQMPSEKIQEMGLRTLHLEQLKIRTRPYQADKALTIQNFHFHYDRTEVLHISECQLPFGGVIAVIGLNGAGKSTFSRCLCGLNRKFKGTVSLDGQKLGRKQLLKKCYMVMQDVNHQLFCETVAEEAALGMTDENDSQVVDVLESLDLLPYKERHPMSLSGGQKQRTAIASAVLAEKEILIYDEPTSGLDYRHMEQTAMLLNRFRGEKTQLIVTHDPELICRCCTHILHMEHGSVKEIYQLTEETSDKLWDFFIREE